MAKKRSFLVNLITGAKGLAVSVVSYVLMSLGAVLVVYLLSVVPAVAVLVAIALLPLYLALWGWLGNAWFKWN